MTVTNPSLAKVALRDQLRAARNELPLTEVSDAGIRIAENLLASDLFRRAASIAAYVSVGREPGTGRLIEELLARNRRVIAPVVLPDLDLDWADAASGLAPARYGLLEPVGPRLGVEAIATPDLVLVPGMACSPTGDRLGQGGGCYDRALARIPVGTPVVVVLYDHEVGLPVPVEPHDRPVTHALSPSGLRRLR